MTLHNVNISCLTGKQKLIQTENLFCEANYYSHTYCLPIGQFVSLDFPALGLCVA